ncbi:MULTISPECIES: VOC family protein [Streptomyces]|uniref:Putative glyoxalase/bleomycin resistance family protein n=1 Tax=Streptomyces albus (strain ATCC 21838 / DSM 41398 / FERM P-419 / JCM 4703 / NBRC 107858) TaxID=1081613 RepID=A0A0B5F131_STRA4|nr:VOC family protein [Streptomyces sp. SCSIO ZS0520]AJE84596.1 putative glyoxalase/bleomycin resistance family protein [Streptomyces albus]AOU78905.1 putative glyoxalase/bleomycin resistance family protein [Streptomyces albus]AYN34641.1 VOC family protein [Streptomyces albus]
MATLLNPYLSFGGDARQALEFYQDVFGGSLSLNTFGESGHADAPVAEQIMHGMLQTPGGLTLMGADTPPGTTHTPGSSFSVCLSGEDAAELRGYWQKLSTGGTVAVPLEKQMWGDEFGMCTDAFGVSWMVNINGAQEG